MPRFHDVNGRPISIKKPKLPDIEDEDLWQYPRREYIEHNFPDLIMNFLKDRNCCSFIELKEHLTNKGVPTDLGYISKGIDELVAVGKVKRIRNLSGDSTIIVTQSL